MTSLIHNHFAYNPKVQLDFTGGNLTSDAGLILYHEFNKLIGLEHILRDYLVINDSRVYWRHSNSSILVQKIYQLLAGYQTDECANALQTETLFTHLLGKDVLASQSSLSRFNLRLDEQSLESLCLINKQLLSKTYGWHTPEQVILDLDSTNLSTYGTQEGAKFNGHYGEVGYHPLAVFDGLTGDLLEIALRNGNVYTSSNVTAFMQPVLTWYQDHHPQIDLYARGDSGFAKPELYEQLESQGVGYAIRLKGSRKLHAYVQDIADELLAQSCDKYHVRYDEFWYQASSWSKARRIVVKVEKPIGQLYCQHMFIVTNMSVLPIEIIRYYCNRGTMENFIKEGKHGLNFGSLSSKEFIVNANKLQIAALAYNLNNWFRRFCLPLAQQHMQMETIRLKLIKIAAKVGRHARKITIKVCSNSPSQALFERVLSNLKKLRLKC